MNALGACLYARALMETKGEEAMAERLIELVAEACADRAYDVAPSYESARDVATAIENMF